MQAPENWASLATRLGVFTAALAAGYAGKRALFRAPHCGFAVMTSGAAGIALRLFGERFMFWVIVLALELATELSPLPTLPAWEIPRLLLVLWIVSLIVTGAIVVARLIEGVSCAFGHHWTWPRRRAGIDTQVCSACGFERRSPIQFDACYHHPPSP
jgi:hypothetical protein